MPITLSAALTTHLAGEVTTLATLWSVTRVDNEAFYFTDHDKPITFDGQVYATGVGYDRTSIEDKADLSADNMDIKGILDTTHISREDIRAGLFDGAEVYIRIVDYTDPTSAIIRRRGWLGEVRQNNLGQFDTELRGLSEALSEGISRVYTPGCAVDLGSTDCGRLMVPDLWVADTFYELNSEMRVPDFPDLIFRANADGTSSDVYDSYDFDVTIGDVVSEGTMNWTAVGTWGRTAMVMASPAPDRRNFTINVDESRLIADPRWYDGGLITFTTGLNTGLSFEVKVFDMDSDDDGSVTLYMRTPFNVVAGDLATIYPGCDKTVATCNSRFANVFNFQGFPHVPGDNYLKDYPDAK